MCKKINTSGKLSALLPRLVAYGGWFEVCRDSVNGSMVRVGKEFTEDAMPLCWFYSIDRRGNVELVGEFLSTECAWKHLDKHHNGHDKVLVLNSEEMTKLNIRTNLLLNATAA